MKLNKLFKENKPGTKGIPSITVYVKGEHQATLDWAVELLKAGEYHIVQLSNGLIITKAEIENGVIFKEDTRNVE